MNSNCQAVGKVWYELEEKDTATVDVLASRNEVSPTSFPTPKLVMTR